MYRRMLIPLDRSKLAAGALEYAARILAESGMDAILPHVRELDRRDQTPVDQAYIDAAAASSICDRLKPRVTIPMHFKTRCAISRSRVLRSS